MNALRLCAPPTIVALLWCAVPHAQQPIESYLTPEEVPRFALAIGVQHYDHFEQVPNALNDLAVAVGAFTRAGFSTIRQLPDANHRSILDGVKELTQWVDGTNRPAVVAIFFAGHGFQDGPDNFVVPSNARPDNLLDDSVPIANIAHKLAPRRAGLSVFFLDACRTLTTLVPTRTSPEGALVGKLGFANIDVNGAVLGYAASYNQAALSRATENDENSPYTRGLGRNLIRPELSLAQVFGEVQTFVRQVTQARQTPVHLPGARIDTFTFMPRQTQAELDAENRHWRATLETKRSDCVEAFTMNYPDSRYTKAALRWLAELPAHLRTNEGGIGCPVR